LLTVLEYCRERSGTKEIWLLGTGDTAACTITAKALADTLVTRMAVDADHFEFDKVNKTEDPELLPGALKYGGLTSFLELVLHGKNWVTGLNHPATHALLTVQKNSVSTDQLVNWLLSKP
jgi:hypothetical protein